MRLRVCLLSSLFLMVGCAAPAPFSHSANPLGWPAKGMGWLGFQAADSELPLVRELGHLLLASSDLLESPAMLVQGLVSFDAAQLLGGSQNLLRGPGGMLTAGLNLSVFPITGPVVDIGRDAEAVNQALAYIEQLDPVRWRETHEGEDARSEIFPPGTRVVASGCNLIWTFPDGERCVQAAVHSPSFALSLWAADVSYAAQERSWGFVIAEKERWDDYPQRSRAVTIIHEMVHQRVQMRRHFLGWTTAYWPAYGWSFVVGGYRQHWAEYGLDSGAKAVNRALQDWQLEATED